MIGIFTTASECIPIDFIPYDLGRPSIQVDSRKDAVEAKRMSLVRRDGRFRRGLSSSVTIIAQDRVAYTDHEVQVAIWYGEFGVVTVVR